MTGSAEIDAALTRLELAREGAASLRGELERLQTLPQASAAYDALLGRVTEEKQALEREVARLLADKTRLLSPLPPPTRERRLPAGQDWPGGQPGGADDAGPAGATPAPLSVDEREARRPFEAIRRFAQRLGAVDNLAKINAILSDSSEPRGAVLFLVDWPAFTRPLPNETDGGRYVSRLRESEAALLEYQDRLSGDVETLRRRYEGVLGVWAVWLTRDRDPQGWERLVVQTRAEIEAAVATLRQQKVDLEAALALLRSPDGGGTP